MRECEPNLGDPGLKPIETTMKVQLPTIPVFPEVEFDAPAREGMNKIVGRLQDTAAKTSIHEWTHIPVDLVTCDAVITASRNSRHYEGQIAAAATGAVYAVDGSSGRQPTDAERTAAGREFSELMSTQQLLDRTAQAAVVAIMQSQCENLAELLSQGSNIKNSLMFVDATIQRIEKNRNIQKTLHDLQPEQTKYKQADQQDQLSKLYDISVAEIQGRKEKAIQQFSALIQEETKELRRLADIERTNRRPMPQALQQRAHALQQAVDWLDHWSVVRPTSHDSINKALLNPRWLNASVATAAISVTGQILTNAHRPTAGGGY